MTLLLATVIAVFLTWALGGRLSGLAGLKFRASAVIGVALAIQLVIFTPLAPGNDELVRLGHIVSYVLVLVFLVVNRRIAGMALMAAGVGSNTLVIAVNGGLMPVGPEAAVASGWPLRLWSDGVYNNTVLIDAHTRLAFLGDIFALPASPVTTAISVGDVLLFAGAFVIVYRACRPPDPAGERHPLRAPLRHASFRLFLTLQLLSTAAGWLVAASMVGWAYGHVGGLVASTTVLLLRGLAGIAAPWVGGRMADHWGPARLLLLTQLAQAALLTATAVALLLDSAVPAYALFTLGSLAGASSDAAARSIVTATIDRDDRQLPAANGLVGTARGLAMAGGALGAGLLAIVSEVVPVVVGAAVVCGLTAIGYAHLRDLVTPAPASAGDAATTVPASTWGIALAIPLISMFAVACLATGLVNAALPQVLGNVDEGLAYGIGIGTIGVGLLLGQALGAIIPAEHVRGRTIAVALLGMAGAAALAGDSAIATTLLLALLVIGLFDGVTETVFDTLVQRAAPEHVQGRVFGVAHTVGSAGMLVGFAVAPLLHRLGGPTLAMPVAAVVLAAAALVGALLLPRPSTAPAPASAPAPATP